MTRQTSGNGSLLDFLDAEYRLNEAEKWLADAQAEPRRPPRRRRPAAAVRRSALAGPTEAVAQADARRGEAEQGDPRQARGAVCDELPERHAARGHHEVHRAGTQDEAAGLPTGLPIYVDPNGLKDAEKTMASTVEHQPGGLPLRTTLRLLLSQLDLIYRVEDGLSDHHQIEADAEENGEPGSR